MGTEPGLRVVYRFPPLNRAQTLFFIQVHRAPDTALARLRARKLKVCEPNPSRYMDWFADSTRNKVLCTEARTEDERCGTARRILAGMFKRPES